MRDPFGLSRLYYDVRGQHVAPTLGGLLAKLGDVTPTFDREAVDTHLTGPHLPGRTMLAEVRQLPPGHQLVRTGPGAPRTAPWQPHVERGDLRRRLRAAIELALRETPAPHVVALSGGLDSAVVLALAREVDPAIGALVLAPLLRDYSEREAALATAKALGVEAIVTEISEDDFVASVPAAIAAFESPLYNLHPVSKWWLAGAARRFGFATVLTGDGADQVFTRDASADYLPLASAAFTATGVKLRAPFVDADVVAHLLAMTPDPTKQELRVLGATLPIPRDLVTARKVSRLAPPLDLGTIVSPERLSRLAAQLGRPLPPLSTDADRVRWSTLALFGDAFGVSG
jgi:hypothetical protein